MIYKALVNGKTVKLEKGSDSDSWKIDGKAIQPDIIRLKEESYHLILDNQSYRIEILKKDQKAKTITLSINGTIHDVQIKDQYDELLSRLGMDTPAAHKANDLKAPMPGLVVTIHVTEGQQVLSGEPLITLEAMKMEMS